MTDNATILRCPSCKKIIMNDCYPRIDDAKTKWYLCKFCKKETSTPIRNIRRADFDQKPEQAYDEENDEEDTPTKERESQADRAVKLCLDGETELFNDQYNTPYARITVLDAITQLTTSAQLNKDDVLDAIKTSPYETSHENLRGESKASNNVYEHPCKVSEVASIASLRQNESCSHKVIIPVKGTVFKTYLAGLMYESEQKVIGSEALNAALNVLQYKAFLGKKHTLYNRVAPDPSGDGSIWLDLADSKRQAYHITKDGWTLEVDPPILFKHFEHQEPLAEAVKNGDAWKLLEYVNVGDAEETAETPSIASKKRLLFMVQCASYLIPDMPHPVNSMHGCKGTYKSSGQAFVRGIFDPSSVPLLSFPRDEHALIAQLEHHWIPIFDNLSSMPRWFSDALCRAVTGAGQETRELYTDDGVVIRQFKRCPMLNGLNIPAQHGDLLDRTILHETVVKEGRRTEAELKTAYLKDQPEILGGFLDAVVIALGKYPDAKPSKLFRLADFTRWGCVLAEALGCTSKDFIEAYEDNVKSQNEETAHASIVATAFIAFCKMLGKPTETEPFIDTPENVFRDVGNTATTMGINIKQKTWSKSPQAFTRKLNEAKDAIASLGVHYDVVPKGIMREFQVWITD